jgi:hypothetical protein
VGEGGAVVRRGTERFGGGQGAGKQQWTVGERFGDRDSAVDQFDDRPRFGAGFPRWQGVAVLLGDALEMPTVNPVADGTVWAFLSAGAAVFQV